MAAYPSPIRGASLLLSFRLQKQVVILIGSNALAASRAFAALEADSDVVVLAKGGPDSACDELRWRASQGQLRLLDLESLPCSADKTVDRDAQVIDDYLSTSEQVRLVCVTDTLLGSDSSQRRSRVSAGLIAYACRLRNILVNVTDMPDLCDFTFLSTHRFQDPKTGAPSSLQVGVTTNGQGCRLANRLRREIVAKLPREVGTAVTNVGKLRSMAKASELVEEDEAVAELDEEAAPSTPNRPVLQRAANETARESARRRMKWVAQVSEYWPIQKLARMSEEHIAMVLDGGFGLPPTPPEKQGGKPVSVSQHELTLSPPHGGRIYLVGSGPGHPSLLTVATHTALTKIADLVLSDKLVPAAVLALIPPEVEVRIARKFPGNADGAQAELMEAAVEAARRGLTVVRLKQGDPSVYGRAGEEILYFREHGFEPVVVPGVSSVLAGPTFAGIPVTQRGAAESFVVCTGVGRQGKEVKLPGYERSRTLVILMGVARLPQMLGTLLAESGEPASRRNGPAFPPSTPIAIIERASMPDQRVIYSTLRDISAALESAGEQRPPGMIVVGWSVLSLWDQGDVSVLDDKAGEKDEERITRWLGEQRWRIKDGLDVGWDDW
ncbi:uroporphyrin-III C-methyltransferase [Laetiporus sulphureus 93-53]|uniref:precorrin-2 dehydrogenase n=1 Tax=Laetiporus sulphureus 93-53 TaxID=1314785 RepID=A0A165FD94_9APHY|nr:uroporphyrin-III C-methyltransferase [Laetiporus sulphureus 93-53]KZT08794.1 uroporphyrin-III C-methyltransferase [Laetiporus sulphureus 93-53]